MITNSYLSPYLWHGRPRSGGSAGSMTPPHQPPQGRIRAGDAAHGGVHALPRCAPAAHRHRRQLHLEWEQNKFIYIYIINLKLGIPKLNLKNYFRSNIQLWPNNSPHGLNFGLRFLNFFVGQLSQHVATKQFLQA